MITSKVLHLITGLNVGGAERMLLKMLSHSHTERFRHVVVSLLAEGPIAILIRQLGVPTFSLGMRRGIPNLQGFLEFQRILREQSPDIVQTWLYHADILGLTVKITGRIPVIWNIRSSNLVSLKHKTLVKLNAALSHIPNAVIVNSNTGKKIHVDQGYRPKKWYVVPNGFDLKEYAPNPESRSSVRDELGVEKDAFLVGLVARFDPMKDHVSFLRAASRLADRLPSTYFVLVGDGVTYDNHLLSHVIAEEKIENRVFLLGRREDIPRLIASLDIATNCSIYGEGFPSVIGEAMACGIPCVVTDVGDSVEIVGQSGLVVPTRNPSALADGWNTLLQAAPERREQMGAIARDKIQQHYSIEKVVQQYENIYSCSLSERAP